MRNFAERLPDASNLLKPKNDQANVPSRGGSGLSFVNYTDSSCAELGIYTLLFNQIHVYVNVTQENSVFVQNTKIVFFTLNILIANRVTNIECIHLSFINPLSPNSDQHQISPCNVKAYSTPEVMRIKDMITQGEFS